LLITFIVTVLITAYALSVLNRERPLEGGEIGKMVGAFIVFILITVVVLAGLMIGSGETDWDVIMPTAGVAVVGVVFTALVAVVLKGMGGRGRHSAS
jgi:hypothetical protein